MGSAFDFSSHEVMRCETARKVYRPGRWNWIHSFRSILRINGFAPDQKLPNTDPTQIVGLRLAGSVVPVCGSERIVSSSGKWERRGPGAPDNE